jgi:hypothetical protein
LAALVADGQLARRFESGLSRFPLFIGATWFPCRHVGLIRCARTVTGRDCAFKLNRTAEISGNKKVPDNAESSDRVDIFIRPTDAGG